MKKLCNSCKLPFDEVHSLDFMNDLIRCSEFHRQPGDPPTCNKNHTWREHVAESYNGLWFNPHFPVNC